MKTVSAREGCIYEEYGKSSGLEPDEAKIRARTRAADLRRQGYLDVICRKSEWYGSVAYTVCAVAPGMFHVEKDAVFSSCRRWRYQLRRIWDKTARPVMFIGLNPSTADETEDDPTVRRCIRFARDWRAGGLIMCNLFAYRATDPNDMKAAEEPVGAMNDYWLLKSQGQSRMTLCAWGNHGAHLGRSEEALRVLRRPLHFLGANRSREPKHPLYLRASLKPMLWIS